MPDSVEDRAEGVLLDTNLLVRLSKANDPQRPTVESALANLAEEGRPMYVVPQCLYEFYVVATRPLLSNGSERSAADASAMIDRFLVRFTLLKGERGVFTRWRELVREVAVRGRPAHDARLVAAMRRHGLSHVLTFNGRDFRRYSDIAVLDPATVAA